jgi:hypothetical protein
MGHSSWVGSLFPELVAGWIAAVGTIEVEGGARFMPDPMQKREIMKKMPKAFFKITSNSFLFIF